MSSSSTGKPMQTSGMDWLGKIPVEWKVERAKWLFKKMGRAVQHEDKVITAFRDGQVTLRRNRRTEGFTESIKEVGYQGIRKGDLVIHAMDAFAGAIGVSDSDGKGSPVYSVCKTTAHINVYYYAHLLREMSRSQYILALAKGIRERSTDFRFAHFANLWLPVPPRPKQDAIVAFLDEKLTDIDRYIATKQRLITLLKEQKAAIINRAVTQGLDSDVALKESGIEWLGEIPAHWEIKRAKFLFKEIDQRSETGKEELLSVSHITGVTPRSQKTVYMFKAESYAGYKLCLRGDLVINIMWAWMGALGVSEYTGIVSYSYGVYRLKHPELFRSEYLDLLLRTSQYIAEYTCRSTGITSSRLRMYTDDFFDMPIIFGSIEEQDKILQDIREKTAIINSTISKTEKEIDLMKELRTALIAEAVTGKIEVSAKDC